VVKERSNFHLCQKPTRAYILVGGVQSTRGTKMRKTIAFLLIGALVALVCSCSDDQNTERDQPPQNGIENSVTNFVPSTLFGRTYTFTVTGAQNSSEPLNADFTIDFNSDTSYTLHPSGQNHQRIGDRNGNYTYEFRSGLIHFVEITPDSGRTFDAVLTFTSATTGSAHFNGPSGQTQDAVFVQSAP
jgi:hypothetical protein